MRAIDRVCRPRMALSVTGPMPVSIAVQAQAGGARNKVTMVGATRSRRSQPITRCSRWILGVVLAACAGTVCAVDKSGRPSPLRSVGQLPASSAIASGATPPVLSIHAGAVRFIGAGAPAAAAAIGTPTLVFLGAAGAPVSAIGTPPLRFVGQAGGSEAARRSKPAK